MNEPTTGTPRDPHVLDKDVAQWLHRVADKHYGGDVGRAMNDALRAVMSRETPPADRWETIAMMNRQRAGYGRSSGASSTA